jgi:hypothetical protein
MTRKLLAIFVATSFVTVGGAAFAATTHRYVGGNTMPHYKNMEPSKNRTVSKNTVGANAAHAYGRVEASKNTTVSKMGAGGNAMPSYASTSKHRS